MKIPQGVTKNNVGLVGVKIKLVGQARELPIAMSFDVYKTLNDAPLRSYLADAAMRNGARDPVVENYRAFQRLDAHK